MNIVKIILLTGTEHFKVHLMLARMFPNEHLLQFAAWRMSTDNRGRDISASEYEQAKKLAAIATSRMNTGRVVSDITRQKISKIHTGRKRSIETRRKMSYASKGRVLSDCTKTKISNANKGKHLGGHWDDKRRLNASLRMQENNPMHNGKNVEYYMTEEEISQYRKTLSNSLLGHEVSEETKIKIGQKTKERNDLFGNPNSRKVYCIEDNLMFDSRKQCAEYYNITTNKLLSSIRNADGFCKELGKHFVDKHKT